MRNETYLLMFIGTEYNKYIIYIDKIVGQIERLISKIKNITLSLGQRWDREVWNFRESGHWDQKVFVLSHTYIISCNSVYIYICVYICVCVCGAFNKFPDFFVQAFKIGVDSWKFIMLLLYILWDDWPILMISASNEQLQQQLEYTLLKPDCHSWWISKMQSDTLEERYPIKFCFKLGKNNVRET